MMKLMTNTEAKNKMRQDGCKPEQEVTLRQSAQLRGIREAGKIGYFVRGRLHVRDQREHRLWGPPTGTLPTGTISSGTIPTGPIPDRTIPSGTTLVACLIPPICH